MMTIVLALAVLSNPDLFVVEASASTSYTVNLSRAELRTYVDDIGLFERNMPGVVGVTALGDNTYLYKTEKEIPFSSPMRVDFLIRKTVPADSVTEYESVDPDDRNYMSCKVVLSRADSNATTIAISLTLRLERDHGSDIHWMAPILGEGFIGRQMVGDMKDMLETFAQNSTSELYRHFAVSVRNR